MEAPKEIIKEGLSEYFIYTIEGTETVPNGWAKRLRSFEADAVPMSVEYRYRPREYGDQLTRLYSVEKRYRFQIGQYAAAGWRQLQIFRANDGQAGLSYLATQHLKYVPIGDKIELNLGVDRLVVFEQVKQKVYRDNLWFQIKGGNLYRKLGEDGSNWSWTVRWPVGMSIPFIGREFATTAPSRFMRRFAATIRATSCFAVN
jgi:hypothetical protein